MPLKSLPKEPDLFYRSLIEDYPELICRWLPDTTIIFVNEAYSRFIGMPRTELLGKRFLDLLDAANRATLATVIECHFQTLQRTSPTNVFEYQQQFGENSQHWVEWFTKALFDDDNHIVEFQSIGRDITQRKAAEEALNRSEANYRILLDNIPRSIFLKNQDSVFVACNRRFAQILGSSPEEVAGKTDFDYLPQQEADRIREDDLRIMANGVSEEFIEQVSAHGRKLSVHTCKSPVRDERGSICGVLGMFLDVTSEMEAEQRQREEHEKLKAYARQQVMRLEDERLHIARDIHDELGQNLTVISFELSHLKKKIAPDDADAQQRLTALEQLARDSIKAVNSICTRLRPSLLDEVGLSAAIDWSAKEFTGRTGISCNAEVDPAVCIFADHATTIFRICQEALTNIARHSRATEASIAFYKKRNSCILEITDNGKGITQKQAEGGNSYGIMGIRERAKLMNATVAIKGHRTKGTTIKLTIPCGENP
ncbi:PAS domain S-box protein [Geobacter pelophilus]|uniref:histidine kinase n=1 Tax=Geoanaerobacter pelophilus TaxID=60036 RepID=A0AAW4KXU6_9BACT|nr:PAS domain S-box protein [Geoanaerobacter pelophilus]MBT0663451.1 PAS domain S-box protein [Geoanaerobacter pelophilus]